MWVYFCLFLLGSLSSFWLTSLIELLYVPSPPLVGFYSFGGSGPVNSPLTESVSIVTNDSVFIFQAEADPVHKASQIRLYKQSLEAVVEGAALEWKYLWSFSFPGVLYAGMTGFNTTNLAVVSATADGHSVLYYWPSLLDSNYTSLAVEAKVTSLALYGDTLILSFYNDTALFRALTYTLDEGLKYDSEIPKSGAFTTEDVVGLALTYSAGLTTATVVSYVADSPTDSTYRQLEFYQLNNTMWELYGNYQISQDLLVSSTQYYFMTPEKMKTAPKFSVRKDGAELLIAHFGRLLSVIKWSTESVQLYFLDTYGAIDFKHISCTENHVLLVALS